MERREQRSVIRTPRPTRDGGVWAPGEPVSMGLSACRDPSTAQRQRAPLLRSG
jgi:hypothetical protein